MRVLMLGWEFPPTITGGLGTACAGLVRALDTLGVDVTFVMPEPTPEPSPVADPLRRIERRHAAVETTADDRRFDHVTFHTVPVYLKPYDSGLAVDPADGRRAELLGPARSRTIELKPHVLAPPPPSTRETGLLADVRRYTQHVLEVAADEPFDVIHAHDWMTFPAALAIAGRSGKPFVAHVHSTESDRGGEHRGDGRIVDIERRGLHAAVRVVAVSEYTKSVIHQQYGVPAGKIDVVYNAAEPADGRRLAGDHFAIRSGEKIVLYLGRLTSQKGPEYFLTAARKVLDVMDDVKFVIAGNGDLARHVVELTASFGIAHKVLFTGFLRGLDVERIFQIADLFVMPSVSEPFGIASLEAVTRGVPTLISKQSGVGEVLRHALKVDFWDTNEMANKIVNVLRRPSLADALRAGGTADVAKLTWRHAAEQCVGVYRAAIAVMPLVPSPGTPGEG